MPGKHVHFVPQYASSSATPSPTFSTSTLSTAEPQTPPELGFGSPYHSIPLPGIPTRLHPILAAQPTQTVSYDLTLAPETMRPLSFAIPTDIWEQPAAIPPVPFLDIVCPELPWRITVSPTTKNAKGVTVGDVFTALYRSLRTNVTKQEYALMPSDAHRSVAIEAYNARVSRLPQSMREVERAKGLKRVDFLGKRKHFLGFAPAKGGVSGWTLLVL
ncbi:hypothetical protein HYPSUDRAFT_45226 [Hypholoma sublateritium FD-334 SS-4]|uniref:DUF6699 domain-containing protein n=1 Tax=Hypholoma sublateritium (strain FD-334 SS-4) TaxID=945553 RepID=A0A0D2KV11_HYPSF|nr:hypothetical protein HYPSUDRAFT_45226 [Hypholoma sublateritium FD-334 SS-4]